MDPIAYIIRGARRRALDPNAVLAVFKQEGLGGGIGDYGTSFGPAQLHIGGALPRAIGARGPRFAQQCAWSPAGLDYALNQIAGVARGQRGRAAVQSIVSRFERPADPSREIAGALGAYGSVGAAGRPLGVGPTAPQRRFGGRRLASAGIGAPPQVDVSGIINLTNQIVGLPALSMPITMPQAQARARVPSPVRPGVAAGPPVEPAPRRGGRSINWLEHFAAPYGLTVTSTTGGKHVKGSYHYRGRAVDFGGSPNRMAALAKQATRHPEQVTEMFYTGPGNPGVWIKNGKVYPNSQLDPSIARGHTTHVHLAR